MDKRVKDIVNPCLDCFSGADGGVWYINFRMLLEALSTQSDNGDVSANEILMQAEKFVALLNFSKTEECFKIYL